MHLLKNMFLPKSEMVDTWNNFPLTLSRTESQTTFKSNPKTYKGGQYRVQKYSGTFLVLIPMVLFKKWYQSTGTKVLFLKSMQYFLFFVITN